MAEMNLTTEEKSQMQRLSGDTVITHEVSEEFNLPDYVPEIRKLLHVRTGALPESRYVSDEGEGTGVELGGTVTYTLIYTDDEGNLCSLPLTSTYEARATLSGRPTAVFVDTCVDTVSPRLSAPRRITLKTKMKSRIQGWENCEEKERIENKSAADELFMERQSIDVKSLVIKQLSLSGVKMSDRLDTSGMQDVRPLWCDATAVISDAHAQSNSVSVRGEATVRCVCMSDGEEVTLTKSMPIAEEIEAQGTSQGDMARVISRPVSLSVSSEQNGERAELFFDLTCDLEGEVLKNTSVTLTRDCYSTRHETTEEYKAVDTYTASQARNCSFTVSEGVKRKGKEITKIIDALCDPVYEKTEVKGSRANILGKLCLTLIGSSQGDNEITYLSESYEVPFKYSLDLGTSKEPIVRCEPAVGSVSARLDGEKLQINAEVYLALEMIDRERAEIMSLCTLKKDKEIKKDAGCVRVYFPKSGDTLWEIAKKYHVSVDSIREQNLMDGKDISQVASLII